MVELPDGKKIEDIYNGLDTIPACDRRTDVLPRHIRAMHTRRAVKTAKPLLSVLRTGKPNWRGMQLFRRRTER